MAYSAVDVRRVSEMWAVVTVAVRALYLPPILHWTYTLGCTRTAVIEEVVPVGGSMVALHCRTLLPRLRNDRMLLCRGNEIIVGLYGSLNLSELLKHERVEP